MGSGTTFSRGILPALPPHAPGVAAYSPSAQRKKHRENPKMEQNANIQPIENIVKYEDGKAFTTSMIVADVFEKEHKDVLKAISNLECSLQFAEHNFALCNYSSELAPDGRKYPFYQISRDGFAFLAMGFTGRKAAAWKEKFLEAFNAMEAALNRRTEPVAYGEAMPLRERRWTFFSPREKMSTARVQALEGLIQMEAFIQGETVESITRHLCREMNVRRLQDLEAKYFRQLVTRGLERLFAIRRWPIDVPEESRSLESMKKAFQGLSLFWMRLSGYSEQEVRNYVLNRCDVDSLDEFATERDMMKALFVLWGGVANHSLARGW